MSKSDKLTILYFGPIAPENAPSIGGYESANRKNINKLRELDVDVVEFANPLINHKFGPLGKLAYIKLFFTPFCLLPYAGKRNVIVHTTPLPKNLAIPSVWLLLFAKLLGIKRLVDVRAGSFITLYKNGGFFTKKKLKALLDLGSEITVEGKSYITDFKNIIGINKEVSYFPNLAECSGLSYQERPTDSFNLFYFGRITSAKGIDVLLDMMNHLDKVYHLYMAGNIAPDINPDSLNKPNITYLGSLSPSELQKQLSKMHFFVFPTRHFGEGQSNSLIEAMSHGLVPITADQGFCQDVVADCGVVLKQGSTGKDYADTIRRIDKDSWHNLSKKAFNHIFSCHNVDIEIRKLVEIYKRIFK